MKFQIPTGRAGCPQPAVGGASVPASRLLSSFLFLLELLTNHEPKTRKPLESNGGIFGFMESLAPPKPARTECAPHQLQINQFNLDL